ncbi:L-2-hydroxyglutarate oxidase LhgO [Inquilinus ginsengisoli]|uniref:L-2-hydroxyglutarate oxidase LhgO n=1 Tax=Inquilinus ginsengisoli TaxID=363840 RepID=A0ABU1JZ11_9PROT|nr:NAD(P)/FAD-dependent oxidoreductase [Inquilinus ginsengisoli]MDR6293558.1 L-2-hydroxyglutarate oxidase LhgO [Inquilinus ginsengisoli]
MTDTVDAVVVGAGVVGLAVARALALAGQEVIILEAADAFGTETSARNSEVIHAGIYYPAGSLKARHCVAGRRALYRFCADHGVTAQRCGKLIVATDAAEAATLARIAAGAQANGLTGADDALRPLTADEAHALEPEIACTAALFSPSTGIVDSHGFMLALLGDAEAQGAMIAYLSRLESAVATPEGLHLEIATEEGGMELLARRVVNAAGLSAPAVARRIAGVPEAAVPQPYLAKGNYFALSGRPPFRHLIYPVPVPGGLGTHATIDLGGRVRFGPDVEWVDSLDYRVDPARADSFYAAIRRYWPALPDGALLPDYSGIRPKITPPGATAADFVIQGPEGHGVAGLVNLFGIESPGLTSSLSIADEVVARLGVAA